MKVPDVGNMAVMVSAVLLAVLTLCSHQTSAQQITTPKYSATIKFQSTTGPTTAAPKTPRTTFPVQASTTIFMPTTIFRKTAKFVATTGYPVSGSSIPQCSWSMWLVITGASLYTLRHLLLQ